MDLTKEILSEHSKAQCNKIVAYIGKNPSRFKKLIQIYLAGPYRITQRAAWPLSVSIEKEPSLAGPHLKTLIRFAEMEGRHESVRRNTMRLLQYIEVPKRLEEQVINLAFKLLQDRKEPVAVRVFSITVLENILQRQPELLRELKLILEDEIPYGSAAFRSRGLKVLNRLKAL